MKSMFSLKWCPECEKVDYFYGFLKCLICQNENCKNCISLCSKCKNLICKNCALCPKCNKNSCINCRIKCENCLDKKYCDSCITNCILCNKQICLNCIKECLECKKNICLNCSKTCKICSKHLCNECENIYPYKICNICSEYSCDNCVNKCSSCYLDICKNCFIQCHQCKKNSCLNCSISCKGCNEKFCSTCSKDMEKAKCELCNNKYCIECLKNLRRCQKCSKISCLNCSSQCEKCKNIFCSDCSIECDNCCKRICDKCLFKCSCDNVFFCEKCLLNNEPIGPHDCVLFMNETPNFNGIKTRSKIKLPENNFEAKFYLNKYNSDSNLFIGISDNDRFDMDSLSFVDNIWTLKCKTGEKYSSFKKNESYINLFCKEGDFIFVKVKNGNLNFQINDFEAPVAFSIPKNEYWIYLENDAPINTADVTFVYIRKI